jgi:hypothetical protein
MSNIATIKCVYCCPPPLSKKSTQLTCSSTLIDLYCLTHNERLPVGSIVTQLCSAYYVINTLVVHWQYLWVKTFENSKRNKVCEILRQRNS